MFVLSFSTFGQVDDAGKLLYVTLTMSNVTQQVRYHGTSTGKPELADAEAVLFGAMLNPMPLTGPPARPSNVLFAYRWGSAVSDALRPFLEEHGIHARLESKQEAERSAKFNDVDA